MKLIQFAEKLQSDNIGTIATDIFINMMPLSVNSGVLLKNDLTGAPIDYYLPGYHKTNFKVIVRAPNYSHGESLIERVADSLTLGEEPLGGYDFRFCRPRTKPVAFPLSEGNLIEFAVDFDVAYSEAV